MPSSKTRINLTVSSQLEHALQTLAKRDETSVSTKVLELLQQAIEIEEDEALLAIAKKRDIKKVKWVSHANAWK